MKTIGTVLAAATLYLNAPAPVTAAPGPLFSASLPTSRSVQVGQPATAFATILNAGSDSATGCRIAPLTLVAATFFYQTTNPATNALTGTVNTPVTIAAGAGQSFAFGFTPTAPIAPTDVQLQFDCDNTDPAAVASGLNTLLLVADPNQVPDIIALSATIANDGIVRAAPSGVFAVAVSNIGASGVIDVSADTGSATLPLTIALCETNPATSACVNPVAPTTGAVTTTINGGATPTFGVFATRSATFPFDPANNRIFVRFRDHGDGIDRGATSVAVDGHALPATFTRLWDTGFFTQQGISADGAVVVGYAQSASGAREAVRWSAQDGTQGLGDLPTGRFESYANSASEDGSVIAGFGTTDLYWEPFRWTLADGMVGLGSFSDSPSCQCQRTANGVSADASVVVGYANGEPPPQGGISQEAFRWTAADGMVRLGPPGLFSNALAVSGDGATIAGGLVFEAFRWTAATGIVGLGDLGSGIAGSISTAFGISADGTVIVGTAMNAKQLLEAFRWTSAGMEGLGILSGDYQSHANDASADGSVVVGWSGNYGVETAVIWDRSHGIRVLRDVLETEYQLDLSGWTLNLATAISDDGKTIAGVGTTPDSDDFTRQAWVVHLGP